MKLKSLLIWAASWIYLIANSNDFKLRDYSILIESMEYTTPTNRPALIIYGPAINEVVFRYMQFPILSGMAADYKTMAGKQDQHVEILNTIVTNIEIKYEYKEKIVEIKSKKRTIIVAAICSTLSAIFGGYLGYKIKEKISFN